VAAAEKARELLRHGEWVEARELILSWLWEAWNRLGVGLGTNKMVHNGLREFLLGWVTYRGLRDCIASATFEMCSSWLQENFSPHLNDTDVLFALHAGVLTVAPDYQFYPGPRFPLPIDLDRRWQVQDEPGSEPYNQRTGKCWPFEAHDRTWTPHPYYIGVWSTGAKRGVNLEHLWLNTEGFFEGADVQVIEGVARKEISFSYSRSVRWYETLERAAAYCIDGGSYRPQAAKPELVPKEFQVVAP
jgi:hypothetical protein